MRAGPAALLLIATLAWAVAAVPLEAGAPAAGAPAPRCWSADLSAFLYLPEDGEFLMPILSVDRRALHLEGRFQYEDRRTVSAWVGWNLTTGTRLRLEVTPMAGAVAGRTSGLAPGLELTLSWKSLSLYSESEYVFDFEGAEGDFFYNWSELSLQAWPWLRFGLSGQRTRMYRSELDVERGIFAAASAGPAELMLYGYNLDGEEPFVIVAGTLEF